MGFKSKYTGIEVEELLYSIPVIKESVEELPSVFEEERSWVIEQIESYLKNNGNNSSGNVDTSNFVDLTSYQEVTGIKDFTNGIKIGSSPTIVYDKDTKSFLFEGNLIISGGLISRSELGDLDDVTVMDMIIVDEETIIIDRTSGIPILKLNPDIKLGGGSNSEGGIDESFLQSYLSNYAKKTDIPTSLPASDVYQWAKEETKPTYDYSELTGKPTIPTIPTYLPNQFYLKFGNNTYNGSAEKTITAADLGALTSHQTIYNLTMSAGAFKAVTFDPNSAAQTVNIPTKTSHLTNNSDFTTAADVANTYLKKSGGTISGDLTVSGTFKATHITSLSTSDERLKENIRDFSALDMLNSMGGVWKYEYSPEEVERDPLNEGTHIGFIYQNVMKSQMKDICIERKDGFGALNYNNTDYLALLAACNLELHSRVVELERIVYGR